VVAQMVVAQMVVARVAVNRMVTVDVFVMKNIPTQIKHYQVKQSIGEGGMSHVFMAIDELLGRRVAIKLFPRELLSREGAYERFVQEARILSQLNHPSIIAIYDFGRLDDGRPYIVMPFMAQGSLQLRIAAGTRFTLAQVCEIIEPIAQALDAAHKKRILHRDIKPENILFDEESRPYLADFGIAKQVISSSRRLTLDGRFIGTPAYTSPEQIKGASDINRRTDIYSLTVVTFELLTGRLPYRGSPKDMMLKHISAPIPQPTDYNRDLPVLCDEVIARGMAKEPQDRYRYASEMSYYLRQAGKRPSQLPSPPPRYPPSVVIPPPPKPRPVWPQVLFLLIVLIVSLAVLYGVWVWVASMLV